MQTSTQTGVYPAVVREKLSGATAISVAKKSGLVYYVPMSSGPLRWEVCPEREYRERYSEVIYAPRAAAEKYLRHAEDVGIEQTAESALRQIIQLNGAYVKPETLVEDLPNPEAAGEVIVPQADLDRKRPVVPPPATGKIKVPKPPKAEKTPKTPSSAPRAPRAAGDHFTCRFTMAGEDTFSAGRSARFCALRERTHLTLGEAVADANASGVPVEKNHVLFFLNSGKLALQASAAEPPIEEPPLESEELLGLESEVLEDNDPPSEEESELAEKLTAPRDLMRRNR